MAKTQNKREALIIVDVQNDFCAGGVLAVGEDDSFIERVNALIESYDYVILTQDWHPAGHISFAANHAGKAVHDSVETVYGRQVLWPVHCVSGTKGAAFHPALNTETSSLIIRKGSNKDCDSYSAFCDASGRLTGLGGFLRECAVEKLTFCGLATDFCIAATALDAAEQGFKTRIALAACQALDIDGSYDRALAAMRQKGVELNLFS